MTYIRNIKNRHFNLQGYLMNKHLFALLALAAFSSHSLAHEFWLFGSSKDVTSVEIGYADDFPTVEKIPDNRIALFEAPYVIAKNGEKLSLKQSGENYHYERGKLENGSYLIAGEYKPTFWTKASDGTWHMAHGQNQRRYQRR